MAATFAAIFASIMELVKLVFLGNIKDAVFIFVFIMCAITCIPPFGSEQSYRKIWE